MTDYKPDPNYTYYDSPIPCRIHNKHGRVEYFNVRTGEWVTRSGSVIYPWELWSEQK